MVERQSLWWVKRALGFYLLLMGLALVLAAANERRGGEGVPVSPPAQTAVREKVFEH